MNPSTLIMCSPTVARHDVHALHLTGTAQLLVCHVCRSFQTAPRVSLVKPVSFVKRDRTAAYLTSVR